MPKDSNDQFNGANDGTEIEVEAEELESGSANAEKDQADEDDIVIDEDAELATPDVIKKLRAKLKTAVEEKQAYLNGWQKDKAEFINARRRDDESKQEFLKFAKTAVVEDMLPVLDSFDMAMGKNGGQQAAAWEGVSKEWRVGIEGIYNQLAGVLAKHDVKAFGAKGEAFDPNLHHSIGLVSISSLDAAEAKKAEDHTIAEVLQKGYTMSGKVIRPALVKVFEA